MCAGVRATDCRPQCRTLRGLLAVDEEVRGRALRGPADGRTRADIVAQLGIAAEGLIVAGFDRPNIRYHVRHREQTGKQLRELLAKRPGPAIVYAPSRDKAEKIAQTLGAGGRPSLPYHPGLEPRVRARNQAA